LASAQGLSNRSSQSCSTLPIQAPIALFGPRAIEAAVSLCGAERIVCGTDGSAFGVDWTRKALADAQIGEDAREQILHRTAAAMLARVVRTAERERAAA